MYFSTTSVLYFVVLLMNGVRQQKALMYFYYPHADTASVASSSHFHTPSLAMQRFQALATLNQTLLKTGKNSMENNHSRYHSLDFEESRDAISSCPCNYDVGCTLSQASSCRSLLKDNQSFTSDQVSISDVATDYSSSESQVKCFDFL